MLVSKINLSGEFGTQVLASLRRKQHLPFFILATYSTSLLGNNHTLSVSCVIIVWMFLDTVYHSRSRCWKCSSHHQIWFIKGCVEQPEIAQNLTVVVLDVIAIENSPNKCWLPILIIEGYP